MPRLLRFPVAFLLLIVAVVVLAACDTSGSSSDDDDDSSSSGEFEVHGPIQALTANSATVQGSVFVVDASTETLGRDNEPIPFSSFAVGDFVEAEGRPRGDGTYRATKIKRDDD